MNKKQNKNHKNNGRDLNEEIRSILGALVERDNKDAKIDEVNRAELVKQGLTLNPPKRVVTVDTGAVIGVENVVKFITSQILEGEKIFSIEGKSGTGKSSAATELKKNLKGYSFSNGELFRYLTHIFLQSDADNVFSAFDRVSYRPINGGLKLFDGNLNVSDDLLLELRKASLEEKIPEVAAFTQKHAVEFLQREVLKLSESFEEAIIVEGRSFTLDFIPCDLRIKLDANPLIRAQRRLGQTF